MRTLIDALKSTSIYLPELVHLKSIRSLSIRDKLFTIELPQGISLGHQPGQFLEVSLPGVGEAPISISSSPSRSNGSFELCIRRVGFLTQALHQLEPGDPLGIRGPFGQGLPVESFFGKDLLLAPGGQGLAPLRSLIQYICDYRNHFGRVLILYGARNPAELLFMDEVMEWEARSDMEVHITVDRPADGWEGNVGVITTLFPKTQVYAPNTVAITIGPPAMYRFVLIELLALGISESNIWLSLERRMKCGVGKCGHCQVNQVYTCIEGPCFSYDRIKNLGEAL
jgi:sulfhydrogenase subunit gamma (sulfur reductase)